jgi:hypothetical protein
VFDSIGSAADTAIRGFDKVSRARVDAAKLKNKIANDAAEARDNAALGELEAGIINREADLVFNVSQEQQAFNKAAIDSGIQADPEDPSFDAAGVRGLNGLATKTQNLAIAQSQGRRLGAYESALKEFRSFVNARPDLAKDAVKVLKRNFGATPTELRLESEKAQAEAVQRERERKEKVGRDLLGATYRDDLSPEQNWTTVIQTQGERVRVQEQKEHLEQLERDITKNDMERKLGQQEAFKNINFDRGVLASKARIDTLNFLQSQGIQGNQPMSREQGIQAMGFLQDTIESLSVEYNNRFSRLPENERKAAIDAVTLPYKKVLDAVSGQQSADNLKLIADNMGTMLASSARLSNENLNTMMGLGINKFDPGTVKNTLKTVFGNRNSEQVVTGALMFPQNDAENKIANALLRNATPNFTDLSDGAAELGKESSQVVKGYQSLMARSIQANLDNDASPKEQFQAANDYATMFTSFNIDAATAQSLGRSPKVTLRDNEQALLDWTNMNKEQLGVLNEHLTDEQKQHIDQARQKYSNDVLKATADLMAESLGSELVDGEAVQREPVSIFTMLGDFAQELVGLVPDVPTVPAIVAEKVDFRSDGGNIRFFLKSQLDSTNPALIATLNKLNGPIADRLRLVSRRRDTSR